MAKKEDAIETIKNILTCYIDEGDKIDVAAFAILDDLENKIGMVPPQVYLRYWNRRDNVWE